MSPLKNPLFGNPVPESLYKTAVLCMLKMSTIMMIVWQIGTVTDSEPGPAPLKRRPGSIRSPWLRPVCGPGRRLSGPGTVTRLALRAQHSDSKADFRVDSDSGVGVRTD